MTNAAVLRCQVRGTEGDHLTPEPLGLAAGLYTRYNYISKDMDISMENLVNLERFILSKRNAKWQDVNKWDNEAKNVEKFISFK